MLGTEQTIQGFTWPPLSKRYKMANRSYLMEGNVVWNKKMNLKS